MMRDLLSDLMMRESRSDILKKIAFAESIYERVGAFIEKEVNVILSRFERAVERSWRYMEEAGIREICKRCAEETGSCCRREIEYLYGVDVILINLLLGLELPKKRYKDFLCIFCGRDGCLIKAREDVCVSYLCERIDVDRVEYMRACSEELGLLSKLRVKIGRILRSRLNR